MNPRTTHLYCVGTPKSGTHSIAAIFDGPLRSAHEAESSTVIDIILDRAAGRIHDSELRRYLLRRDRKLWLEVDSSHLNFYLLDKLVELFAKARFILTIRNPYSWLDSFINHQLFYRASDKWIQMRDFRFRPDIHKHPPEEVVLFEMQLYTLDGYLSYWAHHNRTVIDTVPADRLLIVRTDQISDRIEEIGRFAGVPVGKLNKQQSYAFRAKTRRRLLDRVDQDYLEARVQEHCGDLMARFFPEMRSRKDA